MNNEIMSEPYLVQPLDQPVDATLRLPGSKSLTNRALLVAGLAKGESELQGALFSDDTHYMAEALRTLGLTVEADPANGSFRVVGGAGRFPASTARLYVGNAGTAARFLTAALALGHGRYELDGNPRMRQRPIAPLLASLRALGVRAYSLRGTGCPPVVVEGRGLPGGRTRIAAGESSQYFSALLLAAPWATREVALEIQGELVSKPYIDLTADVMAAFGARMVNENYRLLRVPGRQGYRGTVYRVEPDASGASYFFAAAALTGGRVRIAGLGGHSAQGDLRLVDLLAAMGCQVERGPDYVEVRGPAKLRGIDAYMADLSDVALTLAVLAPFAEGPTTIRGIAHTRVKETDRVAALTSELRQLGGRVEERPDGWRIQPGPLHGGLVATYDDHRMAMSFSLIGLRVPDVRIADPKCVAKTFPDYFTRFEQLRQPLAPVPIERTSEPRQQRAGPFPPSRRPPK